MVGMRKLSDEVEREKELPKKKYLTEQWGHPAIRSCLLFWRFKLGGDLVHHKDRILGLGRLGNSVHRFIQVWDLAARSRTEAQLIHLVNQGTRDC